MISYVSTLIKTQRLFVMGLSQRVCLMRITVTTATGIQEKIRVCIASVCQSWQDTLQPG